MAAIDSVPHLRLPKDVCEDFFAGFCPNEKCPLRHVDEESILVPPSPSEPAPTQPQQAGSPQTSRVNTEGPLGPEDTPSSPAPDLSSSDVKEPALNVSSSVVEEKEVATAMTMTKKTPLCMELLTLGFCSKGETCTLRHPNPDDEDVDLENIVYKVDDDDDDDDDDDQKAPVPSSDHGAEEMLPDSKMKSDPKGADPTPLSSTTVNNRTNIANVVQHVDDVDELPSEPDEPIQTPNGSSPSPSMPATLQLPALGKRSPDAKDDAIDVDTKRVKLDTASASANPYPVTNMMEVDEVGLSATMNNPITERHARMNEHDDAPIAGSPTTARNRHPYNRANTQRTPNDTSRGGNGGGKSKSNRRGRDARRQVPNVGRSEGLVIPKVRHEAHTRNLHFCNLCNIDCNSAENYKSHVAGRKHKQKLAASKWSNDNDQLEQKIRHTTKAPVNPPIENNISLHNDLINPPPQDIVAPVNEPEPELVPPPPGPVEEVHDESPRAESPRSVADTVEESRSQSPPPPIDPPTNETVDTHPPPADRIPELSSDVTPTLVLEPPPPSAPVAKETPMEQVSSAIDTDLDTTKPSTEIFADPMDIPEPVPEPIPEPIPEVVPEAVMVIESDPPSVLQEPKSNTVDNEDDAAALDALPDEPLVEPMRDTLENMHIADDRMDVQLPTGSPNNSDPSASPAGPVTTEQSSSAPSDPVTETVLDPLPRTGKRFNRMESSSHLEQGEIPGESDIPEINASFEKMASHDVAGPTVSPDEIPDLEDGEMPDVAPDTELELQEEPELLVSELSEKAPRFGHMIALCNIAQAAGRAEYVAFKMVLELLVSPNIGVGFNHLRPFMSAMKEVKMYLLKQHNGLDLVFSYWSHFHPELVGVLQTYAQRVHYESILDKSARTAVSLVGDNITYMMFNSSTDPETGVFLNLPANIPMRGRFPMNSDGNRISTQSHGEHDITADEFWQQLQELQKQRQQIIAQMPQVTNNYNQGGQVQRGGIAN